MRTLKHIVPLALLFFLTLSACETEPATTPETEPDTTAQADIEVQEPQPADVSESTDTEAVVKLNLNTASREEFLTIPEVGDRMAHEFEEYRPYVSIQQFRREMAKYVDDAQIAAYENFVFVPVDYNESDAPTLMQLPGVTEETAQILIDDRPYPDRATFLEILAKHLTEEEHAAAEHYLAL